MAHRNHAARYARATCALVFLALNATALHVNGAELYASTMKVATSYTGNVEVAAYLRERLT